MLYVKTFREGTRSLIPKLFGRTVPTLKFSQKPLHTQSRLGNADLVAHMSLGLIGFYGPDAAHSPQAHGPPAVLKPQLKSSWTQRIKLNPLRSMRVFFLTSRGFRLWSSHASWEAVLLTRFQLQITNSTVLVAGYVPSCLLLFWVILPQMNAFLCVFQHLRKSACWAGWVYSGVQSCRICPQPLCGRQVSW